MGSSEDRVRMGEVPRAWQGQNPISHPGCWAQGHPALHTHRGAPTLSPPVPRVQALPLFLSQTPLKARTPQPTSRGSTLHPLIPLGSVTLGAQGPAQGPSRPGVPRQGPYSSSDTLSPPSFWDSPQGRCKPRQGRGRGLGSRGGATSGRRGAVGAQPGEKTGSRILVQVRLPWQQD